MQVHPCRAAAGAGVDEGVTQSPAAWATGTASPLALMQVPAVAPLCALSDTMLCPLHICQSITLGSFLWLHHLAGDVAFNVSECQ